jgi:hypothetical protein
MTPCQIHNRPMVCPECVKVKFVAWNGTAASFWNAIENCTQHRDTEGDHALLAEVLLTALVLVPVEGK